MSSQKGNVTRSRPQRHQNTFSFKNDKFDKSVQTKKINAKLHDGVCQRCKEVLEWRVKYSKYKPLSKPKKCFVYIVMLPPHILWLRLSKGHAAKSLQLCPTLCYPTDGSPPGCPIPGILQARTLEWVAISFSNA
ncbi:uncharacterized protein C9orf85 homolog isoform X3 [Bubalus kerabau]|uniref:uncharacterized protein C9orf85 homolog isoform X3 n=1 Tax=Bubalus carabanensis TaxID=3119969 RepID=UPI00244EB19B|nr:uncharacterized protein C9orf85 homolog isoform X3 [Bubalus carabanensis]